MHGWSFALQIIGTVLVSLSVCVIMHLIGQYILQSSYHSDLAEIYNVLRRHLESLSSWSNRILAASRTRRKVEQAFIAEARVSGEVYGSGIATVYRLPKNHPLSIASLAAEHPMGPSVKDLLAIINYDWKD